MAHVEFAPTSIFDPQVKEVHVKYVKEDDGYMDLLVWVSLRLVSKDFPLEVQRHGIKMLQHLLKFRRDELSSADLLKLTLEMVPSPEEDHISSKSENPKEQSKHRRSLLVLAATNNLRNLSVEETGGVRNENEAPLMPFLSLGQRPFAHDLDRIDFSMALEPNFLSSPVSLAAPVPTSCLEGSPPTYSYNAPFCSKSVLSQALSCQYDRRSTHKHQRYRFPREPYLHSLPFPADSPVPLAYFRLGTKSDFVNVPRKLLEPDASSHSSSSNKSGSSSETSYWTNSESNRSNNSSDEQVNYDESEYEIQRLMTIDISDNNGFDDDHESQYDFADIVQPHMWRFYGKAYGPHVEGCLLLAEHNILCQAFVGIVCLRNPAHGNVLHCILNLLNMTWNKSDWRSTFLCNGYGLSCLFFDNHFLKMVCNMVKLCEDELKTSIEGRSDHNNFVSLLCLILPLLLQLLRCIHSLWKEQFACTLFEKLEKAKSPMNEGLETTKLLEETRDSGYNFLGLCMSLEGAFTELLDSSYFITAFEDFDTMEFRHLRKVILAVCVPLVRHCPKEFWKEWMLEFLIPLLRHCHELLYFAWFGLLYKGRAGVRYHFGKISDNIPELEYSILLEFTRAVCQLLANMTSLESNSQNITSHQDLEYISSNSLVRYLLVHDCFWSLRASLFGYWVDGEAARDGIRFCRALVRLAGVTKYEWLQLFVIDELLPSLIKCIDDELPCAFRKLTRTLNSSVSDDVEKDLIILCRELYDYLSCNLDAQIQDIVEENKDIDSASDCFMFWLAKQKKDLRTKANHPPKEFINWKAEWNWEFEDEFERYLPLYIDMLKEVDAIDDSSKVDYGQKILEKLSPEFRSKYAINSIEHPHFRTISCMKRRKFCSVTHRRNDNKIFAILCQLIDLEPHIKGSDLFHSVITRLEQNLKFTRGYEVNEAVDVLLDSLLNIWEPQYHPMIRKGHKDLLVWLAEQLTKGKEFEDFQPLIPQPEDFPLHLEPYAMSYLVNKLKTSVFAMAEEQLLMHIDFDNHLASGKLDNYICESLSSEDDLSGIDVSSCAVPNNCLALDRDLIKLSLQRRAKIVKFNNQARGYAECLRSLLADDSHKGRLINLMSELKEEGFFDVDSARVNWEKKRFIELVDRFKDEVFDGCSLPRHYVIRGIIDYKTILTLNSRGAFEKVVGDAHNRLCAYLPQFWRETRHYKHYFYDVIREPLKVVTGAI